ncbi:hypothetical protein quinque_006424 [Culex quinquefasciatus]
MEDANGGCRGREKVFRAGSDSAGRIPEQYISALLVEISGRCIHSVETAVCWLKAFIRSHTSQLGSENLLASIFSLGIIEYRVQHANSVSK